MSATESAAREVMVSFPALGISGRATLHHEPLRRPAAAPFSSSSDRPADEIEPLRETSFSVSMPLPAAWSDLLSDSMRLLAAALSLAARTRGKVIVGRTVFLPGGALGFEDEETGELWIVPGRGPCHVIGGAPPAQNPMVGAKPHGDSRPRRLRRVSAAVPSLYCLADDATPAASAARDEVAPARSTEGE